MVSKAKLLRISLLILFVCQPVFAEDSVGDSVVSTSSGTIPPANYKFPAPEEIFDSGQEALDSSTQVYEAGRIWADGLEILVPDLLKMRSQVFSLADSHDDENTKSQGSSEKGIEETNFQIKQQNIAVARPGFGKMKMALCHGVRMVVFTHAISGRKILIYEDGEISDNSPYLSKLINVLKVQGDNYSGVDVSRMVLRHDGSQSVTTHDRSRSMLERKWWAEQWNGKWVSPDKNDYVVGAVFGAGLQALATMAVMGLRIHLGPYLGMPETHWTTAPILLSAAFGGVFGVLGDSYFNFAYNGRLQPLKQAPNSVLFSAAMMYFSGKGNELASITFWATATALVLASKTLSAGPWRKTFKARSDLGLNAGKVRFSFFDQQFALSKRAMERSVLYLAPFFIKNFDYFLNKYEKIPFVDTWVKYIPGIEHMPTFQALLQTRMPYFQIGGAILALGLYRWYLSFNLDKKEVSKTWPEHKANKVDQLIDQDTEGWKKVVNVGEYPEVLKNFAVRRSNSISNGCAKAMTYLRPN